MCRELDLASGVARGLVEVEHHSVARILGIDFEEAVPVRRS
jgi:hypothetical protein